MPHEGGKRIIPRLDNLIKSIWSPLPPRLGILKAYIYNLGNVLKCEQKLGDDGLDRPVCRVAACQLVDVEGSSSSHYSTYINERLTGHYSVGISEEN